ncbi:MAG TPA: excinuclease ABC subunit UvrC [Candidatus Ventrousia excrementavium]|uniref:UvrABC system protein C n=1 Tax=Candidatus Ventrousia excrementavium TaxID=2840961 RepID=A0A9D1LKY7_9CLOT|nr:excinuclease ABC subunit UvrC [Candidatus Ventrousia excrementavium]
MTLSQLRQKAHELPLVPGVYLMRDKNGQVIYVGKAKVLKNRVSQYFANLASHTAKTRRLVENIDDFETIYAKTEFDALLLENTLIKRYKPKYNILLKDDKGYPYVRLGKGEYATFSIVPARQDDGARYFGPYGGRGAAKAAIDIVRETFALPTCTRKFPRDIGKERPCLMLHLNKCCGVCTGSVSPEQYAELLRQSALLLEGKGDDLAHAMEEKMNERAEALDFEGAALLRDRMRAVQKLGRSRLVTGVTLSDIDVLACGLRGTRAAFALLSYGGGSLMDKKVQFFDGLEEQDLPDALGSFIKQYYSRAGNAPRELALDRDIDDREGVEALLSSLRGRRCSVLVPQRGEKLQMVRLAADNARLELEALETREQRSRKTLVLLGEMLGLEKTPRRIEAFDISNTAGSDPVASMTVFEDGAPKKSAYKKFKVKLAAGGDDYGAMAEVVGRRLDRALGGDESFLPLPDLFLMDGGAGQTHVALQQLRQRGVTVPIFGMVKDSHHRTRALVTADGREIGIVSTPAVFALVGRIQEETHRFAVAYHHDVRAKNARRSALDGIPGLGERRRRQLMRHFGTVSAIRRASADELAAVVPRNVAEEIVRHFSEKEQK